MVRTIRINAMAEMTIQQAFELAFRHHQEARLKEAESLYRQILAVDGHHAGALHNLGVIAHQVGNNQAAVELIRAAIAIQPDQPDAHNSLGMALQETGKHEEAIEAYLRAIALRPGFSEARNNLGTALMEMDQPDRAMAAYREAIALNPGYAEAHSNLGNALKDKNRLDEAIAAHREAIALNPGYAEAHNNLGNALKEKNRFEEAIAAYREAIALRPDYAQAHSNLGIALAGMGQPDEAIAAYRRAIVFKPDFHEAHYNLGNALKDKGQFQEAIAAYRRVLALRPNLVEVHSNLGIALRNTGQLEEAMAAYRRAITLRPDSPEAHNNLANALKDKDRFDEAIAAYRQSITLKPDFHEAYSNLGSALAGLGQLDAAIAAHRQAITLKPDSHEAHGNLVFCLNYHPAMAPSAIAGEHRRWGQRHAGPLRKFIQPHANHRTPDRRLRIGYVSPDFREHAVAFFLGGLLENHDPTEVEVFCYSDVAKPDAVTARIQQAADHWRTITGLPDAEVAELVRRDGIDILVDLAGHTANNRLLVFARKPAPVQVTWLGYPNTSGMDTIDYRITDAFADPPGATEELHSEQLKRLNRSAWCYRPDRDSPAASSPPFQEAGHITFGSFNVMPKLNGALLKIWSRILLAVPGSKLLLKNGALGEPSAQQHVRTSFGQAGIGSERLEFLGRVPGIIGHLGTYGNVDIALDTFPYHGTTTTCEALWMGVPVVTLAGQTHASRVGVSLLSNLGHPEWIATSPEGYVKIAVELAGDLPRLAQLRSTLRGRMEASPLMDAPGFAREIEAAYREMWRA
jgi:predicted O-linked N-acetylglucosamine transferase (SPINDLY family)